MEKETTLRDKRRNYLYAALAYAVLVILLTYPLITNLFTHVPGELIREDFWEHLWTFEWVREALYAGVSPMYTTRIFHPDGVSLASHNIAWLNIGLWIPLQAIVGNIAAYNLVFLLIYWLNCWSVFILAYAETDSVYSSFLAGLTFGFWPYVVSHLDHPNLIFIAWIPFSMFALHQLFLKKRIRDMFLFAFFLLLLGLTRWQLLVIGGIPISIYFLFYWWQSGWSRRAFFLTVGGGIIAGLLLLPLALWVMQPLLDNSDSADLLFYELERGQVDLLAFVMPSRFHPLWGNWVESTNVFSNFIFNKLYIPALLFSTLPWVFFGLKKRRPALLWGSMIFTLFILSLGSILRVNGQLYPEIPLPYRLIEDSVFMKLVRRPGRFNIMMGLPIAMLLAHGMASILPKLTTPKRQVLSFVVIAILIFEILPVPFPMVDVSVIPTGYSELPPSDPPYAIVDLPLSRIPIKTFMFYQTVHELPLVEGQVSRRPGDSYTFIDSVPFLGSLRKSGQISNEEVDVSNQLEQLTAVNTHYIIAHKQGFDHHQSAALRNWLPYTPFYDDEQLTIYTTTPQLGEEYIWQDEISNDVGWVQAQLLENNENTVIRITLDAIESAEPGQFACLGSDIGIVECQPLPSFTGLQHLIYTLPTDAASAPAYLFVVNESHEPQREPVRLNFTQLYTPGD